MLGIALTPVLIGGITAAVSALGPSSPTVAITPPAGFQAVTDAYYGYAVPRAWGADSSATDATGDYLYRGAGGWAGETLRDRGTPPVAGEAAPPSLGVFAEPHPVPFTLVGGRGVTVPGASAALAFQLVRGGRVDAQVLDVWTAGSRTELWLAVHADPATTRAVLGSLRGA